MLSTPHTSSNSRSREERTRGSSVPAALGAGSARSGWDRTPPGPAGYGPVLRGRNPASRSPQGDLTRPAFVPFGQPSVPLRTPVVSPLPTGAASSSVLPQPPVAAFPNGGSELPQSSAAAFPNAQLSAQVPRFGADDATDGTATADLYADNGCVGSATTAVVSAAVTNIYADHGSVYASADAIAKASKLQVLCLHHLWHQDLQFWNPIG